MMVEAARSILLFVFHCRISATSESHQWSEFSGSQPAADSVNTGTQIMFYYRATFFNVLFYALEFVFPDQLSRLRRLLPETAVGHFYSPFVPQVVVVMLLC